MDDATLAAELAHGCTNGDAEERLAAALGVLVELAQSTRLEEVEFVGQHLLMALTGMEE